MTVEDTIWSKDENYTSEVLFRNFDLPPGVNSVIHNIGKHL